MYGQIAKISQFKDNATLILENKRCDEHSEFIWSIVWLAIKPKENKSFVDLNFKQKQY